MVGGDGTEGLQNPFRHWKTGRRKSTHFIEEIHESGQLRSTEVGQILLPFVILNQGTEATREIERRRI